MFVTKGPEHCVSANSICASGSCNAGVRWSPAAPSEAAAIPGFAASSVPLSNTRIVIGSLQIGHRGAFRLEVHWCMQS